MASSFVFGSGNGDKEGPDAGDFMGYLETCHCRLDPLHASPLCKHLLHEG